jgi:hypothetical protein
MKRFIVLMLILICLTGAVANPQYIPQIQAATDATQPSEGVLYYSETGNTSMAPSDITMKPTAALRFLGCH